jgi:hypothetical protein
MDEVFEEVRGGQVGGPAIGSGGGSGELLGISTAGGAREGEALFFLGPS